MNASKLSVFNSVVVIFDLIILWHTLNMMSSWRSAGINSSQPHVKVRCVHKIFLGVWLECTFWVLILSNNNWSETRVMELYIIFHVSWTSFKFNRNQLGTVSAYVMWLWLIALLMCTLKWLSSIEIHCHKGLHLKPKTAINYTEISLLICHWY